MTEVWQPCIILSLLLLVLPVYKIPKNVVSLFLITVKMINLKKNSPYKRKVINDYDHEEYDDDMSLHSQSKA